MASIYDYSAALSNGQEVSLANYKGKVLLIVNTASKCGFTPQFEGLEKLNKEYKEQGLEILGFPCNQFMSQDPGTNEEILEYCQVNYGVTFPMFGKVDVNGSDAHPLFQFLRKQQKGMMGDSIKWNFTKFLVDREGNVVERFAPTTTPEQIEKSIEELL
ncbi:glutathione peroxidase [Bacillus horti]|uniref:Glutathione peroxidase n=1 Tax=Caldalkalibacillus horti TaxID=77523 RepID=A0ABT9VVC0_9BACI|nr:glutathione peroxidase [Bacillus horti]MDQ0164909.1 glutathione peroxidase [Bacillus horti]